MTNLLNIVSSSVASESNYFQNILRGFDDHRTFSQKSVNELETIISLITNNINNQSTSYEALLLLKSFLSQVQLDLVEQKGVVWLSQCVKICNQKYSSSATLLAYNLIEDFLEKSVHIPDLGKAITSNLLSKIIESIQGLPRECFLSALKCVETCMRIYPGSCGASRGIIERFLENFIDENDVGLVQRVGKCHHMLQQVRGGGNQGIKQKDSWSIHQLRLIHLIHDVLDLIFQHTSETVDGNVPIDNEDLKKAIARWPSLKLITDPLPRITALFIRLRNLCKFLQITLSEPFPCSKPIQPERILSIVVRCVNIDCHTLNRNSITDNIAVAALLPQIHVSAFQLLNTLILVLGTLLLSETKTILQISLQSLRWTSSGKTSGFKRPFAIIRQAAYRNLTLWCKVTSSGSLVESIFDDLIKHIIQDITPYQSEVTLQVLSGSRKHLSKKARQRLQKAQNDASNIVQTHSKSFNAQNSKIIYSDTGNEALCAAALNTLAQILFSGGCFLKPLHQKIVQENIVSIALQTITAQPKKNNLYFNDDCRLALYSSLNALVQSPHHLCPPPLQYAVKIFSMARFTDFNVEIRDKISDYLRGIEKILHPQKEIFYFPTDADEVSDVLKKNTEQIGISRVDSDNDDDDNENSIVIEIDDQSSDDPITIVEENSIEIELIKKKNKALETIIKEEHKLIPPSPLISKISDPQKVELSSSSSSSITRRCTIQLNDINVTSSPRKSARLNSPSPSSADELTRLERPSTPRRKSARLNSLSISSPLPIANSSEAKISPQKEKLKTISESDQNIDDLVEQMVSEFVDELID